MRLMRIRDGKSRLKHSPLFLPDFRGLSNNYFLLLNWLRSRLLTRRNEREPGEKETGALEKHSRRTTNYAYTLPRPSQIPRNERQRLVLFLTFAYLNRYRAIWG